MDRFLEQKKKANDSESNAQHILSRKTKKQKFQTYKDRYIKPALLNVSLMLIVVV